MKRKLAIITDIDGTLNQKNNPFNYDVNSCTYSYIKNLNTKYNTQTYYVTNRWKTLRPLTEPWLKENEFPDTKKLHLEMNVDPGRKRWNRILSLCKESGADKCIFIDNNEKSRSYAEKKQKKFTKKIGSPLIILDPKYCQTFPKL